MHRSTHNEEEGLLQGGHHVIFLTTASAIHRAKEQGLAGLEVVFAWEARSTSWTASKGFLLRGRNMVPTAATGEPAPQVMGSNFVHTSTLPLQAPNLFLTDFLH